MYDKSSEIKIVIETPSGDLFDAEVPNDIKLSSMIADLYEQLGWPTTDSHGRGIRGVIDLVDSENPERTKRLNADLTIGESGIQNGSKLRVFTESIAGCFLGHVKIILADRNYRKIRDIAIGDLLLSGTPNSKEHKITKVSQVFKSSSKGYLTINNSLHVTGTHPIWANGKWIKACDLTIGDSLQNVDGNSVKIFNIAHCNEYVSVYNLHVSNDEHTFFADNILVHNMDFKESFASLADAWKTLFLLRDIKKDQDDENIMNLKKKIESIGLKIDEIDILADRVEEIEFKVNKIAEAFEYLGKYLKRVKFTPKRKFFTSANEEKSAIVKLYIDKEIKEFTENEQEDLTYHIAKETKIPKQRIKLIDISSGSVLLTLEMPEEAALKLMKLYLNGSQIIKDFNIVKIELRPLLTQPAIDITQLPEKPFNCIRILFLAANPINTPQIRLGEEVRAIEKSLRQSMFRDVFDIEQYWATRTIDLQSCLLRYAPEIVHFSGHGCNTGELILEDEFGKAASVSVRALSSLFSALKDNVKCVVLNACYSEQQAFSIAKEIDCVIGMSKNIKDVSAISFSAAFYQALGYGKDVKTAFDLGCTQIDLDQLNEHDIPKIISFNCDPSELIFVKKTSNMS